MPRTITHDDILLALRSAARSVGRDGIATGRTSYDDRPALRALTSVAAILTSVGGDEFYRVMEDCYREGQREVVDRLAAQRAEAPEIE